MEVILTVEHLRKHYSAGPVLLDVTFQVRAGDKINVPTGGGPAFRLKNSAAVVQSAA